MKNLLFLLFIFLTPVIIQGQENYSIVYEADKVGNKISGNIENLREAIRLGKPVRVGWTISISNKGETKTLEHWTDSKFLTIVDDHVYAQINSIYAQMTSFTDKKGAIKFVDNTPDAWVAIISTSGIMRMKIADKHMVFEDMSDEEIAKLTDMVENNMVATKWAIPK